MDERVMFMVSFLGAWGAIAFMYWVTQSGRRKTRTIQAMTEFHNRLLEKIGSAKDFGDFLESEGGGRFLDSISTERSDPNQRILGAIQTGAVLAMLGLGLFVGGIFMGGEAREVCLFLGIISFSLGAGFLISSGVAYRLSRSWGLVNGRGSGNRQR